MEESNIGAGTEAALKRWSTPKVIKSEGLHTTSNTKVTPTLGDSHNTSPATQNAGCHS